MNSSSKNILIILFAVVLIIITLFLFIGSSKSSYHWTETYFEKVPQPYDIGLLHSLLDSGGTQDFYTAQNSITEYMDTLENVNYVFVNSSLFLDSLSIYTLINFVKRGNDALIITPNPPHLLRYALQDEDIWLTSHNNVPSTEIKVMIKSSEETYRFHYRYGDKKAKRYWRFSTDSLDYNNSEVLGHFKELNYYYEYQNFYSVQLGEGKIYFHTEPLLFTNYILSTEDGFSYAGEVFGHLKDRPIIWDDYHHNPYTENTQQKSASALRYILSQPSLRYAWYSLIAGLLLFLLFYSKRRQRIIPLIPKVENTSIEFAKSLGTLYYQSETPRYLAKEMLKLFDNHNRKRYGISRDFKNKDAAAQIARKARTDVKIVEEILNLERKILYNPSARMSEVVNLYEALEKFYNTKR